MKQERQCEICGKYKPSNEFSKSYPHRCKPCVAEHTKMVRQRAKQEQKHSEMQTEAHRGHEKDFVTKFEIDWEQRRYEAAKSAMIGLMAGHNAIYEAKKLAPMAIEYADALIAELKKGGSDGQTAE